MIYERGPKILAEETVYKERVMRFFYGTALGGLCVLFLRLRFISKIYGVTQRGKRSKKKADRFIKEHGIDMSNYEGGYTCFNDFFIRKRLKMDIDACPRHLIAPADSVLLAYTITDGAFYPVKNKAYTLSRFLRSETLAREYEGGLFLIFRLRVFDFHRFSYADDGIVLTRRRINGVLDTVNQNAAGKFTLCSNVRDITTLRTEHFGDMVMAEIGAMLVGRIVQTHDGPSFSRGEEKGYFEFGGSTVVLLLKKDAVRLDDDILEYSARGFETKVTLGEKIGTAIR